MIRKILVIKMTTGERIKMLRKEHNLTQEELGAKIGVQKAAIQKYEKGTVKNIKRDSLIKLAQCLDTSPEYLLGWEDMPNNIEVADTFFIIIDIVMFRFKSTAYGTYRFPVI